MPKRKRGSSRRQYSNELKAEAVQMLLDGHSAESVVSRLRLSGTSLLYRWKSDLLAASGPAATAMEARVQELEKGPRSGFAKTHLAALRSAIALRQPAAAGAIRP